MFHEAIVSKSTPEIRRDGVDREPMRPPDPRDQLGNHVQDEYVLVQRAIVLEVPDQYRRGVAWRLRQEYGRAGHARDVFLFYRRQHLADRLHRLKLAFGDRLGAQVPDHHNAVNKSREQQRYVSPFGDFREIGAEESGIDDEKNTGQRARFGKLQRNTSRMAMNNSTVVISMVADTAIP